MTTPPPAIRRLGTLPYLEAYAAMQQFTAARDEQTPDEIWLLEHTPVYTQGRNGRAEHLLEPGPIPVVPIDRGGQVTYHGPGQLIAYLLIDIRRLHRGVRWLVTVMEGAVIDLLADHGVAAYARHDAPGVYVPTETGEAKVAALGLRIKRGCSYHGLSLNIDMALEPFARINPCGYPGMAVTDLRRLGVAAPREELAEGLLRHLQQRLGYHSAKG